MSPQNIESSRFEECRVILVEIVGATDLRHPKDSSSKELQEITPFVVASLVDQTIDNSAVILRRTKRMRSTRNPIFCIEHRCLFLVKMTEDMCNRSSCYNLEFDVKEHDANDPMSCTSLGSSAMSLRKVVEVCETRQEERLEYILVPKKQMIKGHTISESIDKERDESRSNKLSPALAHDEDQSKLSLRFRYASKVDLDVMNDLNEMHGEDRFELSLAWSDAGEMLHGKQRKKTKEERRDPKRTKLITEINEKEFGYNGMMNIVSGKCFRMNSINKSGVIKERVIPNPDPERKKETKFLSHEELKNEMNKPSKMWTEVGCEHGSIGTVYLEILEACGLPNMDAGGALGNKTDAFVCVIYEDNMVQTDVIDDKLSPMWMPWSQRAFSFHMKHSLSQVFISVNDFDLGLSSHDGIGRIAVNLNHFEQNTTYTLTYKIHPASNLQVREQLGSIKIRLRKVITDEKAHLLSSLKPMPRYHVNMHYPKTLPIANFTCYGMHNEAHYDIQLLRSYVNEILELKRFLFYAIGDGAKSLILWRGQVKVGNIYLPLHSAIAFFGGMHIVEKPHLLPGVFFLSIAWIMLASLSDRMYHPSPWHNTSNFFHYLQILLFGKTSKTPVTIRARENHDESEKFEANWEHRIKTDFDAAWKAWELQLEMDRIGNEDFNTEESKRASDPLAMALENLKPRLFPIQKRLQRYCATLRHLKAVTSWEEPIIAFWVTLPCIILGVVLMVLPTVWLIHWALRIIIYTCFGPWIRIYCEFILAQSDPMMLQNDEDRRKLADAKFGKIARAFKEKGKFARMKGEQAQKLRAMRMFRFGRYAAKVPRLYVARHYDYPTSESEAEHISAKSHHLLQIHPNSKKYLPSQCLKGLMIPLSERQLLDANADIVNNSKDQPDKKKNFASSETVPLLKEQNIEVSIKSSNSFNDDVIQTFLTCNSEDAEDDIIEVNTGASVTQSVENREESSITRDPTEARESHEGQEAEQEESQEEACNNSLPQDDQIVSGDAADRQKDEREEIKAGNSNVLKENIDGYLITSSPLKSLRTSPLSTPSAFALSDDRNATEENVEEESIEVVLGII